MGYLETIGAYACKNNNYLDSVEKGCENVEPEREKGYLGWFLNLAECLEAYPSPRKGFTFNNVETRSVWLYDGAHWRNTTQGNPFHLIYDIEHAGEVKKGYAQTFYYIPTEEDVRGGTITFHYLIDGKDMWVECDVEYLSDIVFIEWNGSVFVSRVRSLDDRVAYVDSGKVVDMAGNVVVDVADIEDKINKGLKEAVKYTPETKTSSEKAQARSNIDAIGALAVLKPLGEDIVALERGGELIYPYVVPSKIFSPDGKSVEQSIAEEQARAITAEQSLEQGLEELQGRTQSAASELSRRIEEEQARAITAEQSLEQDLAELQGRTQSAASELSRRIEEEKNRAEGVEQELEGGLKEAVKYTPQDIGANAREQARYNIRAVGYRGTYGNTVVLEANGEVRYPETIATSVKMSNGKDNVENVLIETKEKVDTFLADADTSAEAIDKLKELQDYIAEDKSGAAQMLESIGANSRAIEGEIERATNKENEISDSLQSEVERAQQVEEQLETKKADKTGYYENMSVGVSDNLSGRGESSNAEFAMRPSGGENKSIEDGTARINSIKGNSVVLNQQIDNTKWKAQYGEFVVNNGEVFIVNGTPPSDGSTYYLGIYQQHNKSLRPSIGDIILLICDYYPIGTTLIGLNYGGHNNRLDDLKENDWNNISSIFTVTIQNTASIFGITLFGGSKAEELRFKNIKVVNLTKMFGKGNEPTTVEEFELLYGNMSDDFNEGTIIDNHTKAIKSVGVNAWDEEWENGGFYDNNGLQNNGEKNRVRCKNKIEVLPNTNYTFKFPIKGTNTNYFNILWYNENDEFIKFEYKTKSSEVSKSPSNAKYMRFYMGELYGNKYTNDICMHLTHTGYLNGKYLPYEDFVRELPTVDGGLKSALNAYDEIRYNVSKDKWEYVKRIGSVDLGTLNWRAWDLVDNEVQHLRFRAKMGEKFNSDQNDTTKIYNILNKRYNSVSMGDTWRYIKGISMSHTSPSELTKEFVIYDDAYTIDDAGKLKADLSGVMCYYELEEPIITELNIDISPDYKVWDYGTEEAINSELSTPVKLNLNYGFNAVGQITDNTILIEELLARVAQLEAKITQVNSVSDTNEEE